MSSRSINLVPRLRFIIPSYKDNLIKIRFSTYMHNCCHSCPFQHCPVAAYNYDIWPTIKQPTSNPSRDQWSNFFIWCVSGNYDT